MQRKIFAYECLKAVLLHLDANLRIRCALRIPFICHTEKLVPLKINQLSFGWWCTSINGTNYRLGIYRDYHTDDIPKHINEDNQEGGVEEDLDQYGLPSISGFLVLLPGDVSLVTENDEEINRLIREDELHRYTNERRRSLEFELAASENALQIALELESEGLTFDEYKKRDHPFSIHPDDSLENSISKNLYSSVERLRDKVEHLRTELLPFFYRKNKVLPPYTCYLQLTITHGDSKEIQRFPYKKKLFETEKQLRDIMFGNRQSTIIVNEFEGINRPDVFRLPVGFRMRANALHTWDRTTNNKALHSIFEHVNFHTVSVLLCYRMQNLQNDIVGNAKKLVLKCDSVRPIEFVELLGNSKHLELHIKETDFAYTAEVYFILLRIWMSNYRKVGSMFCFELRETETKTLRELLRLIKNRMKAKRGKRRATVKLPDSRRLEVFYEPTRKEKTEQKPPINSNEFVSKWSLKMSIVKI